MADSTPAVAVRGLSKTFARRCVLNNIRFDVATGETVALTGVNGAGKTTLLRCLASLLRPTAGEVRWFGRPAGHPAARRLIGMAAHEGRLYPYLTLRENLLFAARMYDVPAPRQRADGLLGELGLGPHAGRTPGEISRGMRQRLALARALVHDPPLLLLDEPFAGLDEEGTTWLSFLLGDLRARRRTICFSEHDAAKVRHLADRVLEIRAGRVCERDVPAQAGPVASSPWKRAA